MIEPTILWQGNISEDQLSVSLIKASESNRAIDSEVEGKLQASWNNKLAEAAERGATLYDGTSYRLEQFDFADGGLSLVVSPIQFSVRSTLKKMPQLEDLGEAYYSHGLSVGGFVITSDGKYVFIKKSPKSASSIKEDTVGGVYEELEPNVFIGVIDTGLKELKEEINVDRKMVDSLRILGLVRSSTTDIDIVTETRLSISSEELRVLFELQHADEIKDFVIVDQANLEAYLNSLGGYKPLLLELLK